MGKYFAFFDELWGFALTRKKQWKSFNCGVFLVFVPWVRLLRPILGWWPPWLKVMTYRPSALGLYVMTSGQTLSIPSRPTSATKYISCCRTSLNALRMRRPCIFSVVIYSYWRSFVEFFTEWKWSNIIEWFSRNGKILYEYLNIWILFCKLIDDSN